MSVIVVPRLRDAGQLAYPESSAIVQQGAEVYTSSCASRHGADLKGPISAQGFGPAPLDAAGHAWLHSDASLFRMVKFGITGCQSGTSRVQMPSFNEQLDDRSIRAALAFIKNRWPASLPPAQNHSLRPAQLVPYAGSVLVAAGRLSYGRRSKSGPIGCGRSR